MLQLGPEPDTPSPEYLELLNIGLFHYPDFEAQAHLRETPASRTAEIVKIVERSMSQLGARFGTNTPWLAPAINNFGAG